MAALTFDKNELGNLEYSLQREMLATDRRGGYMSTTIVCCNTRKYHGLIVAPIDDSERDFVLLSSLDETIIRDGQRFNLALHRFKDGVYEPRGHKYITDFEYTPCPTITYRVGDVVLKKELLWIHRRTQLMVKYTLLEGGRNRPVTLNLRPFLAFRDRHALSKANINADGHSYEVANGVKCRLYNNFPWLYMQTSRDDVEFVPAPDWYYDFEYTQEAERGYEAHEDLLTPGYFEANLQYGESVIFSASLDEMFSGETINTSFDVSVARRTHKVDFKSCLEHSARQFVVRRQSGKFEVVAGYPWSGVVGREAMIALPGLTLAQGHKEDCMDIMMHLHQDYVNGRVHSSFLGENAVDASLWGIRVLQILSKVIGEGEVWSKFGPMIKSILNTYLASVHDRVRVHDNGLVWAWSNEEPITWMDYTVDPAIQKSRNGYQVEVNALWYNAICFMLELAKKAGDKETVAIWKDYPAKIKESFNSLFWLEYEGYLADFVNYDMKDTSIHSNMIVACGLEHSILNDEQKVSVIRTVQQHLLTPRGLRSMSPINPSVGAVSQPSWDSAQKTGSVWVWPLALYVRSCFKIMGAKFIPEAKKILAQFEDEIQSYGIGSISECFEANPPYTQKGEISTASSVGALLEIMYMVDKWEALSPKTAPKAKKAAVVKKPVAAKPVTAKKATATKTTATAKKAATTTAAAAKPKRAPRATKPKAE